MMGLAIGTFLTRAEYRDSRFARPHRWGPVCHDLGEGEGPCFDARWVESNLATETAEPTMEPVSHLDRTGE